MTPKTLSETVLKEFFNRIAEDETVRVPNLSFCCRIELKMRSPVSALLRDNRITSTWGWAGSCLHKIQDTLAQPE